MLTNWFGEEAAGQGELIAPPPLAPPPAEKEQTKKKGRGRTKSKANPSEVSAPTIPAPADPVIPPLTPAQEEKKEFTAPELAAPPLEVPPTVAAPPLELHPKTEEAPPLPPPAGPQKGPNDDIPDFAPPPSMLKGPKQTEKETIPPVMPPAAPTVAEAQADSQSEAGERMAAMQHPQGGTNEQLIAISKQTNIEVYKYPEKLLLEVPVDLSVISPRFIEAERKVQMMCSMVDAADIKSDDDAKKLTNLIADMKRLEEAVDEARLRLGRPYRESAGKINDLANPFLDRLKIYTKRGKAKLITWTDLKKLQEHKTKLAQDKANRELQEKLRAQAEEENKINREEAVKQGFDPALVPPVPVPTLPIPVPEKADGKIRAEGGTAYATKEWVCEVVIAEDVPREFCVPSQKLLDQAVANGIRAIGGCNIFEKSDINIRKK